MGNAILFLSLIYLSIGMFMTHKKVYNTSLGNIAVKCSETWFIVVLLLSYMVFWPCQNIVTDLAIKFLEEK